MAVQLQLVKFEARTDDVVRQLIAFRLVLVDSSGSQSGGHRGCLLARQSICYDVLVTRRVREADVKLADEVELLA